MISKLFSILNLLQEKYNILNNININIKIEINKFYINVYFYSFK